jgi:modulator of FtsH protease
MVGISSASQILADRSLPARAAAAIGSLILVVVVAGVGLIPGNRPRRSASDLGRNPLGDRQHVTAIAHDIRIEATVATLVARSAVAAVQLVPLAVGSILLIASNASGLYWIAAGMILIIIGSVLSAWVLLIEIRR